MYGGCGQCHVALQGLFRDCKALQGALLHAHAWSEVFDTILALRASGLPATLLRCAAACTASPCRCLPRRCRTARVLLRCVSSSRTLPRGSTALPAASQPSLTALSAASLGRCSTAPWLSSSARWDTGPALAVLSLRLVDNCKAVGRGHTLEDGTSCFASIVCGMLLDGALAAVERQVRAAQQAIAALPAGTASKRASKACRITSLAAAGTLQPSNSTLVCDSVMVCRSHDTAPHSCCCRCCCHHTMICHRLHPATDQPDHCGD